MSSIASIQIWCLKYVCLQPPGLFSVRIGFLLKIMMTVQRPLKVTMILHFTGISNMNENYCYYFYQFINILISLKGRHKRTA